MHHRVDVWMRGCISPYGTPFPHLDDRGGGVSLKSLVERLEAVEGARVKAVIQPLPVAIPDVRFEWCSTLGQPFDGTPDGERVEERAEWIGQGVMAHGSQA